MIKQEAVMALKDKIKRMFRYIIKGVPNVTIKGNICTLEPSSQFEGKTCIVTGGSSGIGYEIAKKWIDCGGTVLITGRNEEKLIKAKKELGDRCYSLAFDSTDIEHCEDFMNKAKNILGDITSLVCNAAVCYDTGGILNTDIKSYREHFAANIDGYYFMTQAFLKTIDMDADHSVLMISSERGFQCDDCPYGLTKAAVNSLIKGINRRLYAKGIRVNGIAPGVVVTDMSPWASRDNLYMDGASSQRCFLPEEIAEVAIFLLSDAAKCISGEIITCDAGNYLDSHICGTIY